MNNQSQTTDPRNLIKIVPGCKLLPLKDLKVGDVFQYHGASFWNEVKRITDLNVYYLYENSPGDTRVGINWKANSQIYVWVKEGRL